MKQLSVDAHFFRRWLLANSVGLLAAAMVSGAIVGTVMLSVVGIPFGILFSILVGAPALIMTLTGGAVFGETIGPPLMGFIALASTGAVIGLMQWTVIKDQLHGRAYWIVASACGWSMAGIALSVVADLFLLPLSNPTIETLTSGQVTSSNYTLLDYAIRYAVTGLTLGAIGGGVSGTLQFFVLRRDYQSPWQWIVGSIIGWAIGGAIASLIITGAGLTLGGLTAGAITAFALRQMSKSPP